MGEAEDRRWDGHRPRTPEEGSDDVGPKVADTGTGVHGEGSEDPGEPGLWIVLPEYVLTGSNPPE